MTLIGRIVDLLRGARGREGGEASVPDLPDAQLAAAALLVHVARVDGVVADEERRTLIAVLESGYGLDRAGAEALLDRAGRMDREIDDVGALVEILGHEGRDAGHDPDRTRLLATAYRVAAADGGLAEFEEDLLWRLGHLLRFDDAAIAEIRAQNVVEGLVAAELGV